MIPGDGNIDWKLFARVLKDIGYKGEFVLEAHHQTLEAPDHEREALFEKMIERSREIVDYYNTI